MTLVFNNFWVEFFPAIKALLRADTSEFARQSSVLFPSQAKCDYFNFGSSGTIQHIDALCFLPQNVVNEKVRGKYLYDGLDKSFSLILDFRFPILLDDGSGAVHNFARRVRDHKTSASVSERS